MESGGLLQGGWPADKLEDVGLAGYLGEGLSAILSWKGSPSFCECCLLLYEMMTGHGRRLSLDMHTGIPLLFRAQRTHKTEPSHPGLMFREREKQTADYVWGTRRRGCSVFPSNKAAPRAFPGMRANTGADEPG